MFLYVVTNRVNGKQYVGVTIDVGKRWRMHLSGHGSKLLHHAIRKYGRDSLQWEVWYEGDEDWIKMMEYRAIVMLDTRVPHGYNLTLGGEGLLGCRPNAETRKKLSVACRGWHHSFEARKRIAAAAKGRMPWNYGQRLPFETRQKMSKPRTRKYNQGSKHPRARAVVIDGVVYGYVKDAALAAGINVNTLRTRLWRCEKSGKWPVGWGFKNPSLIPQREKDYTDGQDRA